MDTWIDKVGASNRFDKLTTFWRKFFFPRSSLTNMDLTSSTKHIKYSGEFGCTQPQKSICNDQQAKSWSWIFPFKTLVVFTYWLFSNVLFMVDQSRKTMPNKKHHYHIMVHYWTNPAKKFPNVKHQFLTFICQVLILHCQRRIP